VRRLAPSLLFLLLALPLAGCVEVEEDLGLSADGSGSYDLRIAWDAALLKRLVDLAGPEAAARLAGRPFPLRLEDWRDSLADRPGLEVRTLALDVEEGGRRVLRVFVRFRRLEDLLGWDLFARRSFAVRRETTGVSVEMDPLARVPFLDPLAQALRLREAPAPADPTPAPELDPPPFERLGVPRHRVDLAAALLAPLLGDVRLSFRVRPPGELLTVGAGGERTEHGARFVLDLETLSERSDRRMRLVYEPKPLDPVPEIEHQGDAPQPSDPMGDSR